MKRIIIFISIISFLLLLTLVSMSNMNVLNLLIFGSDYAAGSNFKMEAFDTDDSPEDNATQNGEPKNTVPDATLETLQSGLLAGAGGGTGSLNLLWLLQNAKDPNKESYAYQLLEAYSNLGQGKYNDFNYHATVESLAASHFNETHLASFVVPTTSGYGKATSGILGKNINGKKITLENAMKSDIVGNVSNTGDGVWYNANGDGGPDGPFQIEAWAQPNTYANKLRSDKKYDGYNFIDALNVVDSKYSEVATAVNGTGATVDPRVINMLYGVYHNRGLGGLVYLLYGLPYTNNSALYNEGAYLHDTTISTMSPDRVADTVKFLEDFIKWYDKSNIPIEDVVGSNGKGRGTALLLILANGGFISKPLGYQAGKDVSSLSNNVINKLFPGQTNKTITSYVNNNYVKKPWDVLGMSKSKYDKIYGSSVIRENYEEIYRNSKGQNTVFYIDKSVTSDNYKAGENVVVRAMEGIAAGYILNTGLNGAFVTLSIAIEAGIKSLTDGTVVDPSNPQIFYGTLGTDTYNPAEAATGNFGQFLEGLGLAGKLTEPQQAQIKAMYDISGGVYGQTDPPRWSIHTDGKMITDCSSFAAVGFYMDVGIAKSFNYNTESLLSGVWQKSTAQTAEVNGKKYPAKTVQLDKNGKPMKESTTVNRSGAYSRPDEDWLPYLQTGDIVVGRLGSNGHVFTYLGKNNTDKDMVLPQHISKVSAKFSTYKPGKHFTIQAAWYANQKNAGGSGQDLSGKMGLMPLWGDERRIGYQAFRPVYNLR